MTSEEIIKMARAQGLPETETEGVFRVNADDLGRLIAAEAIVSALAQQPAAAVPEGYALVPVEPTTAMKCRAVEAWEGPAVYKSMFARGLADLEDKAAECWAAMLAAANKENNNGNS